VLTDSRLIQVVIQTEQKSSELYPDLALCRHSCTAAPPAAWPLPPPPPLPLAPQQHSAHQGELVSVELCWWRHLEHPAVDLVHLPLIPQWLCGNFRSGLLLNMLRGVSGAFSEVDGRAMPGATTQQDDSELVTVVQFYLP
jgi:hypothetical protein